VAYDQGRTAYTNVSIDARDPAASSVDYWSVFDVNQVRRVELSVSKANWDIMWADPDAEIEVEADAVVFPGTGLEEDLPSIGLRMKGNSSLNNPSQKKPWKIDTNEYVDGQEFANLKMPVFNNGFKDPSLTREILAYEMMYQAGVPSSNTCYVEIWISVENAPLEF
jgi:spore coat protein CotH